MGRRVTYLRGEAGQSGAKSLPGSLPLSLTTCLPSVPSDPSPLLPLEARGPGLHDPASLPTQRSRPIQEKGPGSPQI